MAYFNIRDIFQNAYSIPIYQRAYAWTEKEINTLDMLSNGTIDGFIVSISEEAQKLHEYAHFNEIIKEGTPIVMFDRISDEVDCDKVIVDDFDSAKNATQHLINIGCKKIAIFSTIDKLSVSKLRVQGYIEALEKNKIKVDQNIIILTDSTDEFDEKAKILFQKHKIDGIFALDEHTSIAAMKLGLQNGYKIPEDLSIIGFADGAWSRRLTPSLSTVSQHGPEIGEAAAQLLIDRLEEKEEIESPYKTKIIKTELRQRESTRKL